MEAYLKKLKSEEIDSEEIEEENESVESEEVDLGRASSWLAGQRSLRKKSFQETMKEQLEDIESIILDEIDALRQQHAEDEQETRELNEEIRAKYLDQLQNFKTFVDVFQNCLLEQTRKDAETRKDLIQNFHDWMQRVREKQDKILALEKSRKKQVKELLKKVLKFVEETENKKSETLKTIKEAKQFFKKVEEQNKKIMQYNKRITKEEKETIAYNEKTIQKAEKLFKEFKKYVEEVKAYNALIEAKSGTTIIQRGLRP